MFYVGIIISFIMVKGSFVCAVLLENYLLFYFKIINANQENSSYNSNMYKTYTSLYQSIQIYLIWNHKHNFSMQTVTSKLCAHATPVNDFFLLSFLETKKNKDVGIKCKVEKKGGDILKILWEQTVYVIRKIQWLKWNKRIRLLSAFMLTLVFQLFFSFFLYW